MDPTPVYPLVQSTRDVTGGFISYPSYFLMDPPICDVTSGWVDCGTMGPFNNATCQVTYLTLASANRSMGVVIG